MSFVSNALGLGGSSKPSGSTTTVQNSDPWSAQQPYLTYGFQRAQDLYGRGPQQYYPDSTVAPLSNYSNQAINLTANRAINGSPVQTAAQGFAQKNLTGGYYDSANPYLKDTLNGIYLDPTKNTALNSIVDRNAGDITARVNSSFGSAGRTGSGINQQVLARELGDNANQLYGQQYANERNNMMQAAGQFSNDRNAALSSMGQTLALAPQTTGMDFTNYQQLAGAGAALDQQNQAQLTDKVNRWNFTQNAPYQNLQNYIAAIQGNYGGKTSTTQDQYTQSNPISGLLGGGLVGSQIGGQTGIGSGYGALIGSGLGYLMAR